MANCGSRDHEIKVLNEITLGSQTAALMSKDTASLGINWYEVKTLKEVLKQNFAALTFLRVDDPSIDLSQRNNAQPNS